MRPAVLGVLVLIPAVVGAPTPDPQVLWFEGSLECGAGAAGYSSGRTCGISNGTPAGFHKFLLRPGTRIAVIEFEWAPVPLAPHPVRLQVESTEPKAWQKTIERTPILQWRIDNPLPQRNGAWSLWVSPAADADQPAIYARSTYRIAVSLFGPDVAPGPAYSAIKGHTPVHVQEPPAPAVTTTGTLTRLPQVPAADGSDLGDGLLVLTLSAPLLVLALWRGWPLLSLFSRVERDRAMAHPRRQALHDLVAASPGIRIDALRERAEFANGVFRFHLRTLLRLGLLRALRTEGVTYLYVQGAPPPTRAVEHARAEIVQELKRKPGARIVDLARGLSLPESNVRYHLERLRGEGRLEQRRQGREVRCYLREAATRLHSP